jgi:hypothetical protein
VARTKPASCRWWLLKGDDVAAALWGWIDRLETRSRVESLVDRIHEAIYEGRPLGSVSEHPALTHLRRQESAPARLNITRSMVDTVHAKLGKRRPMPVISADDAGWSEKLFAKRASRVLRRKMGSSHVERQTPLALRDCIIRGSGWVKAVRCGGDVHVERVPRSELRFDPIESKYGQPRSMAQVKAMPREVLLAEYGDTAAARDAIKRAPTWEGDDYAPTDGYDSDADLIEVGEGWHLPSGPKAKDGLHVIAVRGFPLLIEKWKRPRFPFAKCDWSSPIRGMSGHSLVEDLTGIQAKVNDMVRDIQEALYWGAMLKVFMARGSNVNKNHLRARHPAVVEYDGAKPEYVAPNPVSTQQVQFLQWLIQQAYELAGISQLSASSKNPLGANASGKALDTMEDIESDRFGHVQMQYAMFRMDIGTCLIDEARALSAEASGPDARIKRSELAPWIREIEWKKVKIDEGSFELGMEAINFLPESRAGKLAYVGELAKNGLITDPMTIMAQMDEPDLARANRYQLGPYRNLERIMEQLADESIPMSDLVPDPHLDFKLGYTMAKGEYNYAMSTDAPEEVLERYRTWLSQLEGLEKKKASSTGGAAAAGGLSVIQGGAPAGPPGMGPMPPAPMPMPPPAPGMPMAA